jgi:hypothetical protein
MEDITKSHLKALLEAAILDVLITQPTISYRILATMFEVSTPYIVKLAKMNGVIRRHGRKPGLPNTKTVVQ